MGARLAGFTGKLLGLSIDKNDPEHFEYEKEVVQIANDCAKYIGANVHMSLGEVQVAYGYKRAGHGVVGELEREAIKQMARREGIILDPVYAGRAFGAMLDLIRKKYFMKTDSVLFWHTGGASALFAYAAVLRPGA